MIELEFKPRQTGSIHSSHTLNYSVINDFFGLVVAPQASDCHQIVRQHIKGSRYWAADQGKGWTEQLATGDIILEELGYQGCF